MKQFILICILFVSCGLLSQELNDKQPWFMAQISNESENIFLVSGYSSKTGLQADVLVPEKKVIFKVSDNQPVKVATGSGIYSIYLHCFFDKDGLPLKTCAVFEKIKAGKITNKIGPLLVFRNYYSIRSTAEQLDFQLLSCDALALLTPKSSILPEIALQHPPQIFFPPFTS